MAGKPNQETGFNSPRRCLTSRGRQDIVYPPSLQHLGMSMVHDRHEIRPPERNITVREGVSGPTFDFPSLSSGFVSTDFASFSAPPSVQNQLVGLPPTRTNHEIAENRYRNDSSPHLDDEHGNPTAHATSTTTLEQQQKYSRPMKYRHPDKADELVRNLTYEDWPPNHGPPVELLVRANMFYQGIFFLNQEGNLDLHVYFISWKNNFRLFSRLSI